MIKIAVFLVINIFILGCDSGLDSFNSGQADDSGDSDELIVTYFVPDNRKIPNLCKTDTDCVNDDMCTLAACFENQCIYTQKPPQLKLTTLSLVSDAVDAALFSEYIYVAKGSDGIDIINIKDSNTPRFIGTAKTSGEAVAVDAMENRFIVGEIDWGIEAFANNNLTKVQASFSNGNGALRHIDSVVNVDINGDLLMVSGYEEGLAILKSNLTRPAMLATVETPGRVVSAVSSKPGFAFTADSLGGMAVINFKDKKIVKGATLTTKGRVVDVDAKKDTGIIAGYGDGFTVLDLSDPLKPQRLFTVKRVVRVVAAKLLGSQTAIVAYENGLISIYDFRHITKPVNIISADTGFTISAHHMDIYNGSGVVTLDNGEVVLFETHCAGKQF